MLDDDDIGCDGLMFIFMLAVCCVCSLTCYSCGVSDTKYDMVKQGKAEYYIDENNQKAWRMKP